MSESRASFFRQSGWLLIASNVGGALMWLVHVAARWMGEDEYSVMTTLLQSLVLVGSVAGAIQTVFAQQAAAAISDDARRRVAAGARRVAAVMFLLWMAGALIVGFLARGIAAELRLTNIAALWLTVVFALLQLWLTVFTGLLQGRQDFLWLGWAGILNGAARVGAVALLVGILGWQAVGGLTGAVFGMVVGLILTAWRTRAVWREAGGEFNWPAWLREVLPLAAGVGAISFVLTADVIYVRRSFTGEESGIYNAAGMVGRALAMFTAPLTAVMFPKIAAAAARAQKSDAMKHALGATALLAVGAAIGCTLFPELPFRVIQGSNYLGAAALMPKLAWCILPLTLGTVLVNSLLARRRYWIVPWLLLVAAAYALGLSFLGTSLTNVIYTLGACGTAIFALACWFTWRP